MDGKAPHHVTSPRDAHDLGIGMVYQHFTLVPNMSVAENLLLLEESFAGRGQVESRTTSYGGVPRDDALLGGSLGNRSRRSRPARNRSSRFSSNSISTVASSSSTSRHRSSRPGEADEILGSAQAHDASKDKLSVLMITHKLREVSAYAEEVTVLRHGRVSGSGRRCRAVPHRPHKDDGRHDDASKADGTRGATLRPAGPPQALRALGRR